LAKIEGLTKCSWHKLLVPRGLRNVPCIVVLGYHDVVPPGRVRSWLQVDADNLARQLRFCQKLGTFLHPDALLDPDRVRHDRLNFLLTFDDGYANIKQVAYPVLQRLRMPFLVFVSTHNMVTGEPFWFDTIVALLQQYRVEEIDLRSLGLKKYLFPAGAAGRRWDAIQVLLEDIKWSARGLQDEAARKVIDALVNRLAAQGISVQVDSSAPLSAADVREMQAGGLCAFGSHGHRHNIFTALDEHQLQFEVTHSRAILEDVVQTRVETIAYPNGNADQRVRNACRSAGYRLGFAVAADPSCPEGDRWFDIPRHLVGGYDSTPRFLLDLGRFVCGGNTFQVAMPTGR